MRDLVMRDLRVKCLGCGKVLPRNNSSFETGDRWAASCPRCGGLYATYFEKI